MPRKPGMTRDDLFNVNAGIIKDIANSIAQNCPKALVAIITNPVNTCVPIAAEILKKVIQQEWQNCQFFIIIFIYFL